MLSFVGVQITISVTSFATVPFLARVLGPEDWGLLVLAQALSASLTILIEYGFTLTGARAIAQNLMSLPDGGSRIGGIYAAKGLLAIMAAAIGFLALVAVPGFRTHPLYLLLAVGSAAGAGFVPWFYFLAKGELAKPATLTIITRLVSTVVIFTVVQNSDDGWLVLAAYGLASLIDSIVMTVWIARDAGSGAIPSWSEIAGLFVEGGPIFAQQAGAGLIGAMGTLVLGGVATSAQVAYYGGAEKMARLGRQLLNTVSRVVFPHMSSLEVVDTEEARRSRKVLLQIGLALGLAVAFFGFLLAPIAVRILFGPGYEQVVPVARILFMAAPFMAVTEIFGTQGLLACGKDKTYSKVALTVLVLGFSLSSVLALFFAQIGMSVGNTVTEVILAVAMTVAWKRAVDPGIRTAC